MTATTSRLRSAAIVAGSGLVGAMLGVGGASLALWHDEVTLTGAIGDGYEYFAAGDPGSPVPAPSGSVAATVGSAEATTLVQDGELAVVFQTDSLSQGNKGLAYELTAPDWGAGVLGSADVEIYWVDSPESCSPDLAAPAPPATVSGLTSTPVSAGYSDTTTPVTEFWCLVATLDGLPGEGEYENEASVTALDPDQSEVSDSDTWNADVLSDIDPADEPDHSITFSYETFRPGETP
ncbi:hypothetical protein LQF12_01395 [Ruania suaedae]|uniref:hypothetical protein n=1 Tax=Ruania suaedae TaxID=2897774 RepID=UPI001E626FC1|nr:hypothetical protein [Ruania suaedae]UFU03296.1 hypothetical protein LQF12_01395 [Ruania suaedae]